MKKYFTVIFCLLSISLFSQKITPYFFGQNAWMPDTVGDAENCRRPPCILNGQLHNHWNDIKNSGVKLVRFGGKRSDRNKPTAYQYIRMTDSIRKYGMEPILQVPCDKNKYTPKEAAEIVKYVNITMGRKVKYWSIGNEPELQYNYIAEDIATYTKAFASAMKMVDPTILTIGPELSRVDTIVLENFLDPGGPFDISGKDQNGNYYIDVFALHYYAFDGSQNRNAVIHKLTSPHSFEYRLGKINEGLKKCNEFHNRSGNNALKLAITEANISYKNTSENEDLYQAGTKSFLAGQFWAEMLGIGLKHQLEFINFFSVIEGRGANTNIGYINSDDHVLNPSYYHFKLMADNFKGAICNVKSSDIRIKSFASTEKNQITVLLMNQDKDSHHIAINKDHIKATRISLEDKKSLTFEDDIDGQSTMLIKFNESGNVISKVYYKLYGNADHNLPPSEVSLTQIIDHAR